MKNPFFSPLAFIASLSLALALPTADVVPSNLEERATCANTATTRSCWGQYSVSTNSYTTVFSTGVTREYWLVAQNTTLSPDGVARSTLNFNGTIPGPQITADWGDDIIVHVTNKLTTNGTSVHWHGMRQLNNAQYDGVPGITQCPIAPGDTLTYKFHADTYGSSWYHSHLILQYGDGLFGPLIINGPATANYDEDLGAIFLNDWNHSPVQSLWDKAKQGGPPTLTTGLMNGTNTYNGAGKKFETTFTAGLKYRIRLVNTAVEGHMQFSIDGHQFTVIANDFVPIVPYNATSILVSIGQRYDIIVTANAAVGNYWIRAGWQTSCSQNANAAGITGILRYVGSSTTADPTTTTTVKTSTSCSDEPLASLVPWVPLNAVASSIIPITLTTSGGDWFFNGSSLLLNWTDPTLLTILNSGNIWPTDYNVIPIASSTANQGWAVLAISGPNGPSHPMHLHGHDFWTLAQGNGAYTSATALNLVNPPRRDVMTLPSGGHLVMAFQIDNPGSWLMHCHIAWHASEGLALQFVESESSIVPTIGTADVSVFQDTCAKWDAWVPTEIFPQDDSGI
ncbi:Laccase-1 [Ciborinia camelliae]|nr:Laccase-1 [Ciborinia camelliae]